MNKVYCCNCRYYCEVGDAAVICNTVSTMKTDYYSRQLFHGKPHIINKDNTCEHWEHKRGFVEWLNDLFK